MRSDQVRRLAESSGTGEDDADLVSCRTTERPLLRHGVVRGHVGFTPVAARWQTSADNARQEAARLRALPPDRAARQITEKRAAAETAQRATTERARRLRTTPQEPATIRDPGRDGPDLGR